MVIDFYTSNLKNKIADVEDAAFASVLYDASGHSIDFYNMDNDKIGSIDASDFIVDGMIEDVYLSGTILTITFNTEAGKEDIEVDFRELFDPSLYYTIQETDDAIESALTVANDYTDEAISHIDLSEYATSGDLATVEEVVSRALNDLNTHSVYSSTKRYVVEISQADYDLLPVKDPHTYYVILPINNG